MNHHEIQLTANNRLSLGDATLISEFADHCSAHSAGRLFFTAPFYDSAFLEWLTGHCAKTRTRIEVVVRDARAAEDLSKQLLNNGCKRLAIYICNRLHAKVYMFESLRHELSVVISSQNPTRAGITRNLEIGVRVTAAPGTSQWRAVADLREFLKTESQVYEKTHQAHRSEV
jgi:hypothetical protein